MARELSRLARLEAALAKRLPEDVAVVCTDPAAEVQDAQVFAAEAACVARAVPKRRREFYAGRMAAHRAMEALGRLPEPVPMGADRAPIWPDGIVGTVSHCRDACVAVLGLSADYQALAVDIEPDEALPEDVAETVCLPTERDWLGRLPEGERARAARLIFSAKECAFKLQYPVTRKLLDFKDVEIAVDVDNRRFEAVFPDRIGSKWRGVGTAGQFGREGGLLFCVMFGRQ